MLYCQFYCVCPFNSLNNNGNPIRYKVQGQDHGVLIHVIVEPNIGGIRTGYVKPDNKAF